MGCLTYIFIVNSLYVSLIILVLCYMQYEVYFFVCQIVSEHFFQNIQFQLLHILLFHFLSFYEKKTVWVFPHSLFYLQHLTIPFLLYIIILRKRLTFGCCLADGIAWEYLSVPYRFAKTYKNFRKTIISS